MIISHSISSRCHRRYLPSWAWLLIPFASLVGLWPVWRASGQETVAVVSAADYTTTLTPAGIASAYGRRLATQTAAASSLPLPTEMGGTTVRVNGQLAPLFFVSPNQINFLIPENTPVGVQPVVVTASGGVTTIGTVQVVEVAPAIFTANTRGTGLPAALLLRIAANGAESYEPVDRPLVFNQAGERLFLLLYLCGVRRALPGTVKALVGGEELPTEFAATRGFAGLDQVNVDLPRYLSGRGSVNLQLKVSGLLSNEVTIEMGGPDLRMNTTTTVASSGNPVVAGQEVAFIVRVTAVGNAGTPTGNVTLAENGMLIGRQPLDDSGTATFTYVFTTTGMRNIGARYEGGGFFRESNSLLANPQIINKAQATAVVASSANPANRDQEVTLTAAVNANAPSTLTPTGVVQFKEGNIPLGAPVTLVNGRAEFTTSQLALGAHNLSVDYYGDPNFEPAAADFALKIVSPVLQITGLVRSAPVYASDVITIQGSGFTTEPAEHEVKVVDNNGRETTAQILSATAEQLRVRVPFGAGAGRIKVIIGGRESESGEQLEVGTSVSGFVQEFKEGRRVPVAQLPITLLEASGRRLETTTNEDGSFILRGATMSLVSVIGIKGRAANGLDYPEQTRKMRVLANRDNQYGDEIDIANIIEVEPNSNVSTGVLAAATSASESLSVDVPANSSFAAQATDGQVTFNPNNSIITFPGGGSGSLMLTVLDPGRTPANLPRSVFSSTIAQLTPFGATLQPGGKLVFPNRDGVAAGTPVRLYRFEQTPNTSQLGQFVDAGAAVLSADGAVIETAPNAVRQASYYFVSPRWPLATIIGSVLDAQGRAVPRAVVNARGQAVFTNNLGGFVLTDVPVIAPAGHGDQVTVEISLVRADGSVARTQRTITGVEANGTIQVTQTFVLPRASANRPPQLFAPPSLVLNEGETRDFNLIAADPDGHTFNVMLDPASSGAFFAAVVPQGNGVYALRLAPGANSAGNYTLVIQATDQPSNGPPLIEAQTIAVTVQSRHDDRLMAQYLNVTTDEDTAVNFNLPLLNPGGGAVTYTFVSRPVHGTLTGNAPNLRYTPDLHYNGQDSFAFKVSSGGRESNVATIFIAVNPMPDAPALLVPSAQRVNAGEELKFVVSAIDVDRVGVDVTAVDLPPGATLVRQSATSWLFSWTPTFAQEGSYNVNLRATGNRVPILSDTKLVPITTTAKWAKLPGIAGGNIRAILDHEGVLYVATFGGGIYRSSDSGLTWAPINTGLAGFGLRTQALAAGSGNLLVGTEGGAYRSVNRGQNWSLVLNVKDVNALLVHGNGIIAGSEVGIFRSLDGGQTWSNASNGLSGAGLFVSALVSRGGSIFAGTNNGVYRSNDNGQSWARMSIGITGEGLTVVTLMANSEGIYAGTFGGGLYRTTDSGQTWVPLNEGLPTFVFALLTTAEEIYAGTFDGLYRTTDGGQSWTAVAGHLSGNKLVITALLRDSRGVIVGSDSNAVYRIGSGFTLTNISVGIEAAEIPVLFSLGSGVWTGGASPHRSNDGGQSWTPITNGGVERLSYITAYLESGGAIYAGTFGGGVYRSTNGGQNWTQVIAGLEGPGMLIIALTSGGGAIFAGAEHGGGVYRTTNEGQSWERVGNGLGASSIQSLLYHNGLLFAGTKEEGIYRSLDNGQSWAQVNIGLSFLYIETLATSGGTLYAGTFGGGVYRSIDNGQSWTLASNGLTGRALEVNLLVADDDSVYAGTYNAVYRTTDGGLNWQPIGSELATPAATALTINRGKIFVGTEGNGVSVLADHPQSWSSINSNLTNKFVNTVISSGNNYYAGTLGGGVLRSSNRGQSWTPTNGLPPTANVQALTEGGARLFAGLFGQGVYNSTDGGANWAPLNNGLPGADLQRNPRNVNALLWNSGTLLAATDGGVFRLPDPTSNGIWLATDLTRGVRALAMQGATLYAGTFDNGVYRSTDQGLTWQRITQGLGNLSVIALGVSTDGQSVYAGTEGGLYRSTDQGGIWQAVNQLPAHLPVATIVATSNKLYVGSVYGVFFSAENGASWQQLNAGLLTDVYITSLAVSGNNLLAGTRVGGVFISTIP